MDKLKVIDIGASGGIDPKWHDLPVQSYLFEPDERAEKPADCDFILTPLSDKKQTIHLYLCKGQGLSSIYRPNLELLETLEGPHWVTKEAWLGEYRVEDILTLEADTLDHVFNGEADYIKLDVQGYELPILRGAVETLKNVVAVELEVEFIEQYKGQDLFGEVDKFLKEQGFEFWTFKKITKWNNRSICTDAFYVRKEIPKDKELKKFYILLAYGYFNLARQMNVNNAMVDEFEKKAKRKKLGDKIFYFLKKML